MTNIIYTSNYRRNLLQYWQQFYPGWAIPKGYQIHHIRPQSTFSDKNDPKIHHPSNLIALHPDDHVAIHKCRGDKQLSHMFMTSVVGRKLTEEQKQARRNYKHSEAAIEKIRQANKGKILSVETKDKISKARKGMKLGPPSEEHRRNLSKALKGKQVSDETKKRLSKSLKGKEPWNKGIVGRKWYNNGIKTKLCYPGDEPQEFKMGRIIPWNFK